MFGSNVLTAGPPLWVYVASTGGADKESDVPRPRLRVGHACRSGHHRLPRSRRSQIAMTFHKALVALVMVAVLAVGGAWLLVSATGKRTRAVVLRTDWVGLRVRITVPSTWSRSSSAAGWIYHTGCIDLGITPIQSARDPKAMLLAIEPLAPYAPLVGKGFAWIPGVEIRQVRPGIDVMVLSHRAKCDATNAVNAALDSLR